MMNQIEEETISFLLTISFFFAVVPVHLFDLCAAIVTAHSAGDHAADDIFRVVDLFFFLSGVISPRVVLNSNGLTMIKYSSIF